MEAEIAGAIDLTHAPRAEQRDDFVGAQHVFLGSRGIALAILPRSQPTASSFSTSHSCLARPGSHAAAPYRESSADKHHQSATRPALASKCHIKTN